MAFPFKDIFVYPSYGKKQCILKWDVDVEFSTANVIIRKSPNGSTGWTTLTSGIGLREYIDNDFIIPNKQQNTYYKVVLQQDKKKYESDSVATFTKLERREYGLLSRMMTLEFHRMYNVGNGLKAIVSKPLLKGTVCECIDAETNQKLGSSQCESCYGQKFEGGYQEPVETYLKIEDQKQQVKHEQSGMGTNDTVVIQIRILAFPELRKNDLITIPESDERYLVTDVDIKRFKAAVPFIYIVSAERLRREDVRYKYDINE